MCFYMEPIDVNPEGMQHTVERTQSGYQVSRKVNRAVFTGDMIVNGGCGFFMEGEPHEMVACMALARD